MEAGDMLLDAASQSGLELPYSCANGMCATCRCKLSQGEGEMAQNFSLEPWEIERGYVLACQFKPRSELVVLDFDAV
jgi:ring-1,2-phenylacetyl-CoA epoxidase subunit PaaE